MNLGQGILGGITLAVSVTTALPFAIAQEQTIIAREANGPLSVGDAALRLPVTRWVMGDPIDISHADASYVAIFNITACPSCRKSLPMVSRLSQTFEDDIAVVSVFAHEPPAPDDPEDRVAANQVRSLLEAMGESVDMPVAMDGPSREISELWGIYAFPSAYLVMDGEIAWIGDPTWLEPVLEAVRADAFDPHTAMREQEAYQAQRQAVSAAAENGDHTEALALSDALIASHPEESSLYFQRYEILLKAGLQTDADRLALRLIGEDLGGFDWDHFVPLTYIYPENPNYDVALRVTEMAISRARWDLAVASLLSWKSKIFLDRADNRSDPELAAQDLDAAIASLREAAEFAGEGEDSRDLRRFEAELSYVQFRRWSGIDDGRANAFLDTVLREESPRVDWVRYIEDALRLQETPNYTLLLWAADRAYIEAYGEAMQVGALAAKAQTYAAMQNHRDAIALYETAIEEAEFAGDQQAVTEYSAALSLLQEEL